MSNIFFGKMKVRHVYSILILVTIFCAFWNINIVLYPLVLGSIVNIFWQTFKKKTIEVDISDLLVIAFFVYEFYSFGLSGYKINSFSFLFKISITILLYFNIKSIFERNTLLILIVCFSSYILIINLLNTLLFFIHYSRVLFYGFNDLTQFRFLFVPFGVSPNEWIVNLLLMLLFPLTLYIYIIQNAKTKVPENNTLNYFVSSKYFLVGLIFTINIQLFNIIVSFSRGGYIALCFIFIIVLFLLLVYKRLSFLKLSKYLSYLFIIPFIAVSLLYVPVKATLSLNNSTTHTRSTEGRINIWSSAITIFKENPINGIGTNNFALNYNSIDEKGENYRFTGRIANSYLQLLVEKGIVGVFFYILLFAILIFFVLRHSNIKQLSSLEKTFIIVSVSCFSGVAIRELTYSSVFFSDGIAVLLCMLLALTSHILFSDNHTIKFKPKKWLGLILILVLLMFVFGSYYYTNGQNSYTKFKECFDKKEFSRSSTAINNACQNNSQNSYYLSCKALSLVREYESGFNRQNPNSINMPVQKIQECINIYKNAIAINPNDDNFYHNLGWLFFYCNDYDTAIFYIKKAKKVESTISLYHISLGLMYDFVNQKDSALKEYSTALYLTPELVDSQFWRDMELGQPLLVKDIIEKVKNKLESNENSNDPIVLSKKAKVYIYLRSYKKAKEILLDVTKKLPNLSRPWYNIGYLYEMENDTVNMLKCYNIALLNDIYYYMPCLRLAYYYDKIGFKRDAVQNYKATINYWNRISTENSQRSKAFYFIDGIRSNVIPMGLLEYTKPGVDTLFINKRIQEIQNNY